MYDNISSPHAQAPADALPLDIEQRSVVIIVTNDKLIGPDLRWPLRIAKPGGADITLLICVPKKITASVKNVDLSGSAEQPAYVRSIADRTCPLLDNYLGANQWTNARAAIPGEVEKTGLDAQGSRRLVKLQLLPAHLLVETVKRLTPHPQSDLVLFVGSGDRESREHWIAMLKRGLRSIACSVGLVVPGVRQDGGELLVAAGRGLHGHKAINLAAALAAETGRRLTSLFVEPDIGADAEEVGRRILGRLLKGTLAERMSPQAAQRVVIHNKPAKGISKTCRERPYEVLVMGAARLGALGELRSTSVANTVLAAGPDVTLIAVRNALPLESRLIRWMLLQVQRRVPQLLRANRIELVERIQSNSRWNFDFMLLIVLSTFIAALGLLDNSPAVIIGAMLVAPLMTPLLGLGLAIAQGNAHLERMTLKAVFLGFITAFWLGYAIGLLSGEFQEATAEMSARDWPQLRDLIVAFVSGFAAAYASARPGLLAALPGVAIAAALLPPVATAGLAVSIGDYDLCFGALLLFGVNMVSIIVAAAVSFWLMGVRAPTKAKPLKRLLDGSLVVVSIVMALVLTFAPPLLEPPRELIREVESMLADEYRLRRIRLHRDPKSLNLQVDVGGSRPPDSVLRGRLRGITQEHLGKDTAVRLTFRYETLIK